jgi:hypothetical protein
MWRIFHRQISGCETPQFATQTTTKSPRFTIQKTPQNSETPNKNAHSTTPNFFPQKIHTKILSRPPV